MRRVGWLLTTLVQSIFTIMHYKTCFSSQLDPICPRTSILFGQPGSCKQILASGTSWRASCERRVYRTTKRVIYRQTDGRSMCMMQIWSCTSSKPHLTRSYIELEATLVMLVSVERLLLIPVLPPATARRTAVNAVNDRWWDRTNRWTG
jgi:hypothetical protein